MIGAIGSQSDAMEKLMMRYKLSADYSQRQIELLEQEAAAAEEPLKPNANTGTWTRTASRWTPTVRASAPVGSLDRYVLDTR